MATTVGKFKSASGKLWEACIGLEVHAQIRVRTKLFSGASAEVTQYTKPNTHVAFLDAALPGTLPVLNQEAVHQALRTAIALGCDINRVSRFERKHYFYCDLPQGYQITQQALPIATGGTLRIEPPIHDNQRQRSARKKPVSSSPTPSIVKMEEEEEAAWPATTVRIARLQLEQDSGKSTHEAGGREGGRTLIDLNRAGAALMEIVFEPDLCTPSQAAELVRSLQATLRELGTCDGHMDEGSLRCDLNVSVRPTAAAPAASAAALPWGPRAEIKNLNSLKSLQTAAAYEIARQIALSEENDNQNGGRAGSGGETAGRAAGVRGETRSFNVLTGKTTRMRGKEGAVDYRFFPEPDLPPLVLKEEVIEELREGLPELPQAMRARLEGTYGLTPYQSSVLVREGRRAVRFFEEVVKGGEGARDGRNVANWICNDLVGLLKAKAAAAGAGGGVAPSSPFISSSADDTPSSEAVTAAGGGEGGLFSSSSCLVTPPAMGELNDLVASGAISIRTGKEVLSIMVEGREGGDEEWRRMMPSEIVEARGWGQISDEEVLRDVARKVARDPGSERQRRQYTEGKERQMMKYFVGQAMKATGGRAHPERMEGLLREMLGEGEGKGE
ncbi:hypothetical protein VYU27_004201 [Nannochloropsis oceanica]